MSTNLICKAALKTRQNPRKSATKPHFKEKYTFGIQKNTYRKTTYKNHTGNHLKSP